MGKLKSQVNLPLTPRLKRAFDRFLLSHPLKPGRPVPNESVPVLIAFVLPKDEKRDQLKYCVGITLVRHSI